MQYTSIVSIPESGIYHFLDVNGLTRVYTSTKDSIMKAAKSRGLCSRIIVLDSAEKARFEVQLFSHSRFCTIMKKADSSAMQHVTAQETLDLILLL